ncbi:MAG: chorismate lyase [Synechococcus sp. BS301-5m-G54]|nr:chorismate lyase [Synechococcus sp. BS301-5m-G54]MBL6797070.1 chorismate lyase [Synechococcus sp. BS307-5m-G34]
MTSAGSLLPSPQHLWQAPTAAVLTGEGPRQLPGPWRLMLLGDGSPTRHLRLLTGQAVAVDLIGMTPEPLDHPDAPPEVKELTPPLLRRQVWLHCDGLPLAWAESWWNQTEADLHLRDRNQPIWRSLTEGRSELFREVDGLALVNADWLELTFGLRGPFWSRHYRFFRGGKALTVIREVFSPQLETWLGPTLRQELQRNS